MATKGQQAGDHRRSRNARAGLPRQPAWRAARRRAGSSPSRTASPQPSGGAPEQASCACSRRRGSSAMISPAAAAPATPPSKASIAICRTNSRATCSVGRANAVHHLDRRAVIVERAARREDDRRGAGEPRSAAPARRPAGSARFSACEQRGKAGAMGDEARARHRPFDRPGRLRPGRRPAPGRRR